MYTIPSFTPKLVRLLVSPKHALFVSPGVPFKFFLCFHNTYLHTLFRIMSKLIIR
jgi:hypothetical protein